MLEVQNWKSILQSIYTPPIGSLWVAPNGIWTSRFAHNKDANDTHPSVVGRIMTDNQSCWLIPGTSQDHMGSSVFKTRIDETDPNGKYTHFLINLLMTYTIKDLMILHRGWNGIDTLSNKQVDELKLKIFFCLGINV